MQQINDKGWFTWQTIFEVLSIKESKGTIVRLCKFVGNGNGYTVASFHDFNDKLYTFNMFNTVAEAKEFFDKS